MHFASPLCRTERGNARRQVGQRHAEGRGHGHRTQHVRQLRQAGDVDGDGARARRRFDQGARAQHAKVTDPRGPHLGSGRQTEGDDPSGEAGRPRHHACVIRIRHEHGVGAGPLENLGLGLGNAVGAAEVADVRVAHVGPHAHVRLGHADQHADFPRVVHAELHHRDVRAMPKLEQRERQSEVVVEVARILHDLERSAQQRRNRFLRAGLACAPGDGHHPCARLLPHGPPEALQRVRRVIHPHHRGAP